MHSADTLLIGFDAREDSLEFSGTWDDTRRRRFLLRHDIEKPLSVDSSVWPSAFDLERATPRPQWTGYVQDLWEDLYSLAEAAEQLRARVRYAAFGVLDDSSSAPSELSWRERVPRVNPPSLEGVHGEFVGYDVADYYLLSGLMNCAFTEEERREAARWIPHLNRRHLFDSRQDALAFKRAADGRVPEHAPFFVFGVWLLQDDWASISARGPALSFLS